MPHMHAEMDRMFDVMLSPRVRGTAPSLEAEDRAFLAGAPPQQEPQQSDDSSEVHQENAHSTAWSSSSFSSFSSSGGGPVVQTTKSVYDTDTGEVREVRRRSVGDQLVVEHHIHRNVGQTPETNSTRRLHNIDEAQMEEFESHFSSSAGSRAGHATLEPTRSVPAPAPPPLAVSPEDVASLHRVMPELSESDATDLLRRYDGNLRAAMRAGLQE